MIDNKTWLQQAQIDRFQILCDVSRSHGSIGEERIKRAVQIGAAPVDFDSIPIF